VNVTNFPLDEYGTLRVTTTKIPSELGNLTQKITVFSTEAQFIANPPNFYYLGGIELSNNSEFAFGFNPAGTPFNITSAYVSVGIIGDAVRYNGLLLGPPMRVWITINDQTDYLETETTVLFYTLTALSIPISNSTVIESIHQGINTLQIAVQSNRSDGSLWIYDKAYELSVLIEYECLA
jgi:hypothetical protein